MVLDDVDVDLRLSVLKPIHKLGSLACTTIYLALKADSQLQKDGSGSNKPSLEDPFEDLDQNIADSRTICS